MVSWSTQPNLIPKSILVWPILIGCRGQQIGICVVVVIVLVMSNESKYNLCSLKMSTNFTNLPILPILPS